MQKPIIALCVVASLAACETPQQVQQHTFSSPESIVATQLLQDDLTGTLSPNQPQTRVGQVLAIELIKTFGAALRGGVALAIDRKFNRQPELPFDTEDHRY